MIIINVLAEKLLGVVYKIVKTKETLLMLLLVIHQMAIHIVVFMMPQLVQLVVVQLM